MNNVTLLLVCENCGSQDVEIKAWIYANTGKYAGETDDSDKGYCPKCDKRVYLTDLEEYKRKQKENETD